MVKGSPVHNPRPDIPAAVMSPHDQQAHGLLQDLNDQCPRVLTHQPLPTPTLPHRIGKSH